jgi:ribosomal protein S18 acetylase RimI-like enzyme
MKVDIVLADYRDPADARCVGELLDAYARDPMGGGKPLSRKIRESVASELARVPGAFSVLAFVAGEPAGLTNCLQGFSTFQCRPLINIHDVVVLPAYRGNGLCARMLTRVEEVATQRGCCKVTLEVLDGNQLAKAAYRKLGYRVYELDPAKGRALFFEKPLTTCE